MSGLVQYPEAVCLKARCTDLENAARHMRKLAWKLEAELAEARAQIAALKEKSNG